MPRRARASVRTLEADSVHRSRLVQQTINKVMLHGKKATAEQITYDALAIVGERSGRAPVEVLEDSIKELTPVLEVRSRRLRAKPTSQRTASVRARRGGTSTGTW